MLLSSAPRPPPASRRSRSKSWSSDLAEVSLKASASAPNLFVSPHRLTTRKVFDAEHLLANVQEGRVLSKKELQTVPPPLPSSGPPTKKASVPGAWDLQDTWSWYNELPWLAGMNYLSRSSVNFVELWDETSFDLDLIAEELNWAADKLGYNTLRTNLPMVLFEHDAEGLKKRVNQFLNVAAKHGFVVTLVFLDDCEFSGKEAKPGPQPDPIPNLHNSQAIGSPGRRIVLDESQWFRVEKYIRWAVKTWGKDPRVFLLDLYNEPGNPWVFTSSGTTVIAEVEKFEKNAAKLMEKCFAWAREEKPRQPLTVSAWHMPDPFFVGAEALPTLQHPCDQRAMELSDVISIHAYCDHATLQAVLLQTAAHGKPILLTEWMARQVQSTYDTALPTLKELKVGAYQWGLVKGKTQTHLPWPHVAHQFHGDPVWWHDVLDSDGNFHNEQEGEVIRSWVHPQNKALSSDIFVEVEIEPTEHMEVPEPSVHIVHSSQHHLAHIMAENSHAQLPVAQEGEHPVIPSVCSISMAAINAAAAAVAGEVTQSMLDMQSRPTTPDPLTHPTSMPTFGSHRSTANIEGLDLAEFEGIEF